MGTGLHTNGSTTMSSPVLGENTQERASLSAYLAQSRNENVARRIGSRVGHACMHRHTQAHTQAHTYTRPTPVVTNGQSFKTGQLCVPAIVHNTPA